MANLYLSKEDAVDIAMDYVISFSKFGITLGQVEEVREVISNEMEQKCVIVDHPDEFVAFKSGYIQALDDLKERIERMKSR